MSGGDVCLVPLYRRHSRIWSHHPQPSLSGVGSSKGNHSGPQKRYWQISVEHGADALHDLLAGPLTPLLFANFLDRRIAEPLQESVTISGPEAVQNLLG